uniref:Capsid protein n=1 Tax=Mungbean yellow mosaic virus TaxID=33726 RepID=S5W1C6_9GEMI|nr:AV1 [Mungbean yellow mosaic virus]AGS77248.1 AV1 [Mungbean yellow mosaic virus]UTQ11648.1 coat protein [Mungbean yellow mosaic virus]UTQ11655.1 coat protein [Mungbean yellow mosaic virus]UTQ11669.1 coat protein [Mungbean yellow mosaic virus]
MPKRNYDTAFSTPISNVRRRLTFDTPLSLPATAGSVPASAKRRRWTNRPMWRKPKYYRLYRSPDVPRGCEGPCKVQSFEAKHDISHVGKVICVTDVTRGMGITHRVGKRFCVKSIWVTGKIWMDENIKTKNHTNTVMFKLVRDRRPFGTPQDFGQVFNMYDNEPSTATVKNDLRDRYQVVRKFQATVTGGQYASKEQAIVSKFYRVNNYVVYNHQEAAKYENHTENALLLYMACTHASNPVYATLKIRIYFYDSISN